MTQTDGMRPYAQYCPVTRAVEVLGERWSFMIVRDMLCGATRFNELARGLPGLSRGLLSRRLDQLQRAGVVEHVDGEYHLTEAGEALRPVVDGLADWGARFTFGEPRPEELDPDLLVWWMHQRIDTGALPRRKVVIKVEVTDRRRSYWIVVDEGEPSVCLHDPAFEVDVVLRGELASLYRVWLGRAELLGAARDGEIEIEGVRVADRDLVRWLQLSPVSHFVRAYA